jgi:putative transcriptional regulator
MLEELKIARVRKKMNQTDTANYLGISSVSYCRKETGKNDFTLTEIKKLMELFNKKFEELF